MVQKQVVERENSLFFLLCLFLTSDVLSELEQFQCCGVNGYTDWFKVNAWPDDDIVPDSCCRNLNRTTGELSIAIVVI